MGNRIAIIDDEQIVLSLIQDALEGPDTEIFAFYQPSEAVAQIPNLNVELVVSDIRMPGMDGTELMAALRERGVRAPFVFMTGYASLDSAKEAIRLGASGYINKPFELRELRETISKALKANDVQKKSEQDDEERLQTLGQLMFDSSDQQSVIHSTLRFSLEHSHADDGILVLVKGDAALGLSLKKNSPSIAQEPIEINLARLLVSRLGANDSQSGQLGEAIRNDMQLMIAKSDTPSGELERLLNSQISLMTIPVSVERAAFGVIVLGFADDSMRLRRADLALLALTGRQLAITLYNQELLQEAKEAYGRLNDAQDQMIGLERLAERGETSAEVGHELNNFLQVVRGNVELINLWIRKGSYDQMPTAMSKITDAVVSMTRFTAELMGDNDSKEERVACSLTQLVKQVIERVTIQRRYRGIQVISQLPEKKLLSVQLDQTRIQQLLYNLLNNAADAMKSSATRDLIISVTEDAQTSSAIVSIKDTGCGFSPEHLQRAFSERFTTKENGHGFGLLVCKKIVENHAGTLEIESTQGKGTTMTLRFPLAESLVPA